MSTKPIFTIAAILLAGVLTTWAWQESRMRTFKRELSLLITEKGAPGFWSNPSNAKKAADQTKRRIATLKEARVSSHFTGPQQDEVINTLEKAVHYYSTAASLPLPELPEDDSLIDDWKIARIPVEMAFNMGLDKTVEASHKARELLDLMK